MVSTATLTAAIRTGVLDYRPTDLDRWFLRGSYARFEDDEYRNRLSIAWDDGTLEPGATDQSATWSRTRIGKQFRHRVQRNELTTYAFGGEHERGRYFLDYTAAYSIGEQAYPHRRELLWRSAARPTLSYDYGVSNNDSKEEEFSLAGNLGFAGALLGNTTGYKFGLKWRSKDKDSDGERWRDRSAAAAPSGTLDDFLSSTQSDNYDYLLGRAALTRGISRPNFRDIVPRALASATTSVLPQVALGNPDLRATMANNLDLSLEYYIEPLGLISASVFYKDLEDYQYTQRFVGEYAGAPARLVQPQNARSGEIMGFKVSWSQQFDILPGWWSGFGIFANYTYTYTDATMNAGGQFDRNKLPLEGQSKTTLNLSGVYEAGRFNVRLSYTTRDDHLAAVDGRGSDFDVYWQGRDQLDLTASVQITPQWETFLEAKNLTDTAGKRYLGSRSRTYEYEKFGAAYFLGVRFNL